MGGVATRVLITGGAGLVATHLLRAAPAGLDVEATVRSSPLDPTVRQVRDHRLDLRRAAAVDELLSLVRPDVVVHTAYSMDDPTQVVDATEHVAAACARVGAALVHLSTDAVFDGATAPYAEADLPEPVNDYGRWKAAAERTVAGLVPDACIVRLSLVVSADPLDTGSRWLLGEVRAGRRPTLFADEVRCPIRGVDLAAQLWALVGLDRGARAGIWHLPGPEALSRVELGRRVLVDAGLDPAATQVGSCADHPQPRPADLTMVSTRRVPGPPPRPVP